MRKRHSWIVGAALCAGSVISSLPAIAQTLAETAPPSSEKAVETAVPETLVPELTLGAVPGLVPSHVQGLSAELSPSPAPGADPQLVPAAAAGAGKAADPVASPSAVAAPVAVSPEEMLAEQVVQNVRLSLGKPNGKDERGGLASFYANANQPLWVGINGLTPRARALVAEFKRADDWGLRAADFEVPQTAAAKPDAKPADLADVEIKLGLAALKYARHARGGRVDPNAISDNLDRKAQLLPARDVMAGIAAAPAADTYLRKLHPQHRQFELLRKAYLAMRDGTATTATVAVVAEPEVRKDGKKKGAEALAAPLKGSVRKLLANMEMWRWMPADLGSTHVFVNVPEFQFRLVRDGAVVHAERVITGKTTTQTPIFSDKMETVVFKPRWNVPDSIKVKELLPALYKSRDALARQDLKIELNGQAVDPRQVNWSSTDIRAFHVYQPSGNANALGVVKFLFPNKHAVYLHDTPTKNLFDSASRAYSHGCIRIRNPVRFAEVLMEQDKKWTPAQVKAALSPESPDDNHVGLARKFPVHIAYFTATAAEDGQITYYKDIYEYEGNINLGIEGKANQIVKPPKEVDTPIQAVRRDDPRISAYERAASKGSGNPDWARSLFGMN
jgi:L,D-transpeptidase YcbB